MIQSIRAFTGKMLIALLVVMGTISKVDAQLVCPPNIDLELGDLSGWRFFIGSFPGGTPTATTPTTAIACRQTLTKISGLIGCTGAGTGPLDQYGGFSVVAPGGGSYSMRIGNQSVGAQTDKARFYIHIPPGSDNYSLIYRYAVVFQSPTGHSADQMPQFVVTVFDSAATAMAGGTVPVLTGDTACSYFRYTAGGTLPGFLTNSTCPTCSPPTSPTSVVQYKSWATATVDLSGLAGTTVGIDFLSADCSLTGHFGYGYIDMNCGLFKINATICDTSVPPVLSAPEGFATYTWYDSATFTTIYGSGMTITIPYPPSPTTIAVVLQPYPGYGCPDTLYTRIKPSALALHPSNDTDICKGRSVVLYSDATDIAPPLYYSWSPATGLSCTTCATPVATPTVTTAYSLTVTNVNGCTQKHTYNIGVRPDLITTITYDTPSCAGYANAVATVNVLPSSGQAPYHYVWSTAPVQTDSVAIDLAAGTYTVVVEDSLGCVDTNMVVIPDPAPRVIDVDTFYNPTTCLGSDGIIVFEGSFVPDTSYTISYNVGGVPQTRVATADASGKVTINGLSAGVYTDITVIYALCPYDSTGPVTLVDPPIPDLSGVTSNSFVCEGDTLLLFATSTTTGAVFSWEGPGGYTSGLQNPIITPVTLANAGVYSVTVSKASCYNYATTLVDVRPLPLTVGGSNTPVCSNDTLFLTSSSANGATSYFWTGPDLFTSMDQNPYVAHVQTVSTGVYTVAITLNGCTVTDTVGITINQTPLPPYVLDTNYCQYDQGNPLFAIGDNITWYTSPTGGTGVTTPPIPSTSQKAITTWYATQTSPEGCTSQRIAKTVRVWEYPHPQMLITDTVVCAGTYATFSAEPMGEGVEGITWVFDPYDSVRGENPVKHSYSAPGAFTVSAYAYYNYCPDTIMHRDVLVYPYAYFDLGGDTTICPGSNAITLKARTINTFGNTATWEWSTGEKTPTISIVAPGIYRATVTINGCQSTDSVIVGNDCYMNIPNVFTPNGDGLNDYFFPRSMLTAGLVQFSMNIYNRWGQLIFTTNALDGRGWDGAFNGNPQPEGVYVYIIEGMFKDGQKEKHQGNVTLLR